MKAIQPLQPTSLADVGLSPTPTRDQMNIVIVGHVDHGKSTLVGRMLADTGSIDPAAIAKVRAICEKQGKRFEYAFLLDALEAEQAQGITIDAARCFFQSALRDYIIIDAPGHIEFLKNMISGAARAEAAVLLIDADEGVQENSRRHGYMLSLLGIRKVVVAVNKMDLVDYDQGVFDAVEAEYRAFLKQIDVEPAAFIPISALEGGNVAEPATTMPWYTGGSILEAMDAFQKDAPLTEAPMRMPVQDIYKFTRTGDTRRIIAGRVSAGTLKVGDAVVFLPSNKRTHIATVEAFAAKGEVTSASAGQSCGVTMTEQIYIGRGDVMCHVDTPLRVSNRLRVNIVWLGRKPLTKGHTYKLKLATYSGLCEVEEFIEVIDASALDGAGHDDRVERHEVAEVVLSLRDPIAADLSHESTETGRFVLVDGYDMAGGGIIREVLPSRSGNAATRWTSEIGAIDRRLRETRHGHRAAVVALHDDIDGNGTALAEALEESFWTAGRAVYRVRLEDGDMLQPRPGEIALNSIAFGVVAGLINAGQVVLVTVPWTDDQTQHETLKLAGLESVTTVQVRFNGESDGDSDWVIDARRGERAIRDDVKTRLEALVVN